MVDFPEREIHTVRQWTTTVPFIILSYWLGELPESGVVSDTYGLTGETAADVNEGRFHSVPGCWNGERMIRWWISSWAS